MRTDDEVRLRHMLDAARKAVEFADGRNRADLDRDTQLVFALVKAVEIVGEAGYQVGSETRVQLSGIPWDDMVGMRHRLVHAYFDVNLDILWTTVREDIPRLISELEKIFH